MTDPYQPQNPSSSSGAPQPPPGYGQQPGSGQGQQPGYPPAGYPPAGYPPGYAPDPPGRTLGIIGFVLAFVFSPAGIVLSAMALSESKKVGWDNALGKWGLWLSIIFTAIGVLAVIAYFLFFVLFFGAMGTMGGFETTTTGY